MIAAMDGERYFEDPILIDVRALAASLPPKHGKLARDARRWVDAHSNSADLTLAHDYVRDAIALHQRAANDLDNATAALLQAAIIIYARPFDSSAARHRGTLDVISKMSPDDAAFHERLIVLRHQAVAHFAGGGTGEAWAKDYAVLLVEGETYQTLSTSRRSLFQPDFAAEFAAHLDKVHHLAHDLAKARQAEFERRLAAEWEASIPLDVAIFASTIDPAELHGWDGPILGGARIGRKVVILKEGANPRHRP